LKKKSFARETGALWSWSYDSCICNCLWIQHYV